MMLAFRQPGDPHQQRSIIVETESNTENSLPESFDDIAASRRAWIDDVLHPWVKTAPLKQLRKAEAEWLDIAGRVDVKATLWTWAWERFAGLTHPELSGVNETHPVRVTLNDGSTAEGFPDSRASERGMLVIVPVSIDAAKDDDCGPWSIDDIQSVEVLES